jgi:acetyltransferase-like isoleucine patch superfamily enzyme
MIVIYVLLILICLDLIGCSFYCHQKKKKASIASPVAVHESSSVIETATDIKQKPSLRKILGGGYNKLFSSLLRLSLAVTAKIPSHHVRTFLYKTVFAMTIGKKAVIYYGAEIRAPWMITIGEGTVIGDKAILDGRFGISIGKNCNFSTGAWLWTLQHDVNDPWFTTEGQGAPIIVGDRSWLSCRTVILPGVKIGEGSVIAAGAVVTKSTVPYSINGGIPGKKIGERNKDLKYEFDGSHVHFL